MTMAESSNAVESISGMGLEAGDQMLSSPVAGVVDAEELATARASRPWKGGGARSGQDSDSEMNSIDGSPLDEPFGVLRMEDAPARPHSGSITDQYYGNSVEVGALPHIYHSQTSTVPEVKKISVKQSRRLPPWIWYILCKMLGIKLHTGDKPIFGTFMHVLTVLFALCFAVTYTWFKIFDIISEYTKETALTGCVSLVIALFWCILGIYANKLARKLFQNPKFVDSVRLHSKTVIKINTAGLMIILATTMIVLTLWNTKNIWDDEYCQKVGLSPILCKVMYVSKVAYAIPALIWNLLVGIVLLSVCRTHTIGIRRLIRELELDGKGYETMRKTQLMTEPHMDDHHLDISDDEDNLNYWEEEQSAFGDDNMFSKSPPQESPPLYGFDHTSPLDTPTHSTAHAEADDHRQQQQGPPQMQYYVPPTSTDRDEGNHDYVPSNPTIIIGADSPSDDQHPLTSDDGQHQIETEDGVRRSILIHRNPPSQTSRSTRSNQESPISSMRVELNSPRRRVGANVSSIVSDANTSPDLTPATSMLTNDEILLSYWKINCRLRQTSLALQRWLVAWVMFVIIWSVTYIIYWVRHEATMIDITEFLIPILLLPLICSAYGEVNYEGRRMLRCICPTQERTYMLFYLTQQPLEMNAFGFAINYSAIVTTLGALGVAFSTRIILDELKM